MKTTKPVDPRKKLITELASKLVRMRRAILEHHDETSTVLNLRKLLDAKIVSLMKTPEAGGLRDKFARLFAHKEQKDLDFTSDCLKKAVREFFTPKTEFHALGHMVNALHQSKYANNFGVDQLIEDLRPNGWVIPKRKQEAIKEAA